MQKPVKQTRSKASFKGYLESTVESENFSYPDVQLQNGNMLLNLINHCFQGIFLDSQN